MWCAHECFARRYPAACGKSRHRASPACSVAIVREGIGGILDVRWDISRERPLGGLLEAVLRPLGGCLGASWGPLWASRRPLGASWGPLRAQGSNCRCFFPLLDLSWGCLGAILGCLGRLLGRFEALLGRLGTLLGASRDVLGRSWGPLEPSWSVGSSKRR